MTKGTGRERLLRIAMLVPVRRRRSRGSDRRDRAESPSPQRSFGTGKSIISIFFIFCFLVVVSPI